MAIACGINLSDKLFRVCASKRVLANKPSQVIFKTLAPARGPLSAQNLDQSVPLSHGPVQVLVIEWPGEARVESAMKLGRESVAVFHRADASEPNPSPMVRTGSCWPTSNPALSLAQVGAKMISMLGL
jgi:hypothetical protein